MLDSGRAIGVIQEHRASTMAIHNSHVFGVCERALRGRPIALQVAR